MSTQVRPMRDRLGRVYTPAVGRGLHPLLWTSLIGFALLFANGFYLSSVTALTWYLGTTQQTFFYMLMVAFHLLLGFALIVPFLLFGFAHLATAWKRPNKTAVRFGLALLAVALVILISGILLVRLGGFEVRDPRVARPATGCTCWLRWRRSCSTCGTGWRAAHPLGMGPTALRGRWRLRRRDGTLAFPGPALVRREGPQGGQAVLLSVGGHHQNRQLHSRAHAHDGRLLPQMSSRRLRRLVSLGAPLKLVQQPGLQGQRAATRRVSLEADRSTQAALVRRLP